MPAAVPAGVPAGVPAAGPLVVLGGGRMGEAVVRGLIAHGWPAGLVAVVETAAARRAELAGPGDLTVVATVDEAVAALAGRGGSGDAGIGEAGIGEAGIGAVIAVKPHDVEAACRSLAGHPVRRVLSIAAGVGLADLDRWVAPAVALRAMPNTPALVGAAASALSPGTGAGAEDVAWARSLLAAVGHVVDLPESALDAVTGLSGSGPAYVFLVAEALIDAGVLVGLTRPVAKELAVQTLLGSARLLAETGDEPSALRAAVTSPGGTTAAGVRALESAAVRAAIAEAVVAATERARQLAQPH